VDRWPGIAEAQRDDFGRPGKWTFFYPEEEYRPELLAEELKARVAALEATSGKPKSAPKVAAKPAAKSTAKPKAAPKK
jgi:hypothetical protein